MIPKKLLDEIERFITQKRFGHIQINFIAGNIVSVNRVESIKVEMKNGTATVISGSSSEV